MPQAPPQFTVAATNADRLPSPSAVLERYLNSLAQQQDYAASAAGGGSAAGTAARPRPDLAWVAPLLFILLQSPLNSDQAGFGGKLLMRISRIVSVTLPAQVGLPCLAAGLWCMGLHRWPLNSLPDPLLITSAAPHACPARRSACRCGAPCRRCSARCRRMCWQRAACGQRSATLTAACRRGWGPRVCRCAWLAWGPNPG